MKVLSKLLIKSYLGPFFLTFFIVLFVLVMQFLWNYVDDLVGKGLEFFVILELIFLSAVTLIPMALPLAVLLSAIMTFGGFAESYELTAIKSAGISLYKFMIPLVILNFLIAILAFVYSNEILPRAFLKYGQLLYDVRTQKPALDIKPGIFYDQIDGYILQIAEKGKDNQSIKGVKIWDHSDYKGNRKIILAESGKMALSNGGHYLMLELENGQSFEDMNVKREEAENKPFLRTSFTKQKMAFDLSAFKFNETNEDLFKDHHKMLNIFELEKQIKKEELALRKRNIQAARQIDQFFSYKEDSLNQKQAQDIKTYNLENIYQKMTKSEKAILMQKSLSNIQSIKNQTERRLDQSNSSLKQIRRLYIEWHKKFTLSVSCFILFLIGAPMGAIIRKGGLGLPMLVSVGWFLIYYLISVSAEKSSREMVWNPEFALWLSTFILAPIGLFLLIKANKDSKIFQMEAYFKFLAKFRK